MPVITKPIYMKQVWEDSTPSYPQSIEASKSTKANDIIGYGWMSGEQIQPGFGLVVGRYNSLEDYAINRIEKPGVHIGFYLGSGHRSDFGSDERRLPSKHFHLTFIKEPTPVRNYRGENELQKRAEIWLTPEWIQSGLVERLDDTGTIRKALTTGATCRKGEAPSAMLAAASRLFAAPSWHGPLSRLHREGAAITFLAEALAAFEVLQDRPLASSETRRVLQVKETLDSLPPYSDVTLVELAARHSFSVRSLTRQFKQAVGTSVIKYLADRRMDQARSALQRDELSIDQAAHLAGFAHTPNFAAAFKRRYGSPPGSARNRS